MSRGPAATAPTLRLLGELQVEQAGRPLPLPASKKTRALLGYLVASGAPQTRERLCELFWDGPVDPRSELRWSLSKLRGVVSPEGGTRLLADRQRVSFEAEAAAVDLLVVREVAARADTGAPVGELESAAALFRGELLEGLDLPDCYRFHEWLLAEREAARALRVRLLATLCERLVATPAAALRHARSWAALDPLDEGAHTAVVRLLGALGRGREALEQVETCRRILRQELGASAGDRLEAARRELGLAGAAGSVHLPEAVAPPELRSPATTSEPPAAPLPALVGRGEEREVLAAAVAAATSGHARGLLFLLGEPGIGKSRLLLELAARVRACGGEVLQARAFQAETLRPYGAWVDALRSSPVGGEPWPDLAPLLPELGAPRSDAGDRAGLFDAVVRRLAARARPGAPTLLLLDDLHWLDEAGAALLHYVVRALGGSAVLLAGAARQAELAANPPVASVARALEREGWLRRLQLGPLPPTEAAALVLAVAPGLDPLPLVAESEGNPLFLVELARSRAGGGAALESLELLLGDRLARLGGGARRLGEWAAALGRSFGVDTLRRVTGLAAPELEADLGELERAGVVRPAAEEGTCDFTHDLLRRAAYRQLSPARARLLHGRIAEVLATLPDDDGALAGEVAHHAALAGAAALAARACLRAGDRCLRLFALVEAAEAAERGLRHLSRLAPTEALPLEVGLLRVHVHAAQGRRHAPELEARLQGLVDAARAAGMRPEMQVGLYLLAVLNEERGDPAGAERLARDAAESLRGADPATAVRALANTGRCLGQIERDPDRAASLLEEARALAERHRLEVVDLPWGLGLLRHHQGRDGEAVAHLERAVELARREQDHWSAAQCGIRLAMLALEAGDGATALARCQEVLPVAARLVDGSEGPVARVLASLAARMLEEPGAEAAFEEDLAALRAIDTKGYIAFALNVAARLELQAGRPELASPRAAEALAAAEAIGRRSQAAVARALLARADHGAGRRGAFAVADLDGEPVPNEPLSAWARREVAAAAAALASHSPTSLSTPAPTAAS